MSHLYLLISDKGVLEDLESLMEGSIGVEHDLQDNKPESKRSSRPYFVWLRTIPLEERATSKPRKNLRSPMSLM